MRKDGAQQGDCEEGRSTTRKNALGWGPSINKIWAGNLGPVDLKLSNFCLNGLFKFKESHPVRNLILTSFTVWKSRNRRAITLEARWNPKCSRWKIAKRKVFVTKTPCLRSGGKRVRDQVLRGYYVWLDVVEWRTGAQSRDLIVERSHWFEVLLPLSERRAGPERQEETRERRTRGLVRLWRARGKGGDEEWGRVGEEARKGKRKKWWEGRGKEERVECLSKRMEFCFLIMAFLHVFVINWRSTKPVDSTIASLTPLFSWLKRVPPGINPSSRQQKKGRRRRNPRRIPTTSSAWGKVPPIFLSVRASRMLSEDAWGCSGKPSALRAIEMTWSEATGCTSAKSSIRGAGAAGSQYEGVVRSSSMILAWVGPHLAVLGRQPLHDFVTASIRCALQWGGPSQSSARMSAQHCQSDYGAQPRCCGQRSTYSSGRSKWWVQVSTRIRYHWCSERAADCPWEAGIPANIASDSYARAGGTYWGRWRNQLRSRG